MTIKRYSIAGTNCTPPGYHDYVMADDYDALAIDLAGYKEAFSRASISATAANARCRELEAALRKYGSHHHIPQCTIKCDCGLAEFLTAPETSSSNPSTTGLQKTAYCHGEK